jgi:hypothetical protein
MGVIDHIEDFIDRGGTIIDLGIIDGGIPLIGQAIGTVLGIIVLSMLVGELFS